MAGRLFFCLFRRHLGVDGVVDEAVHALSLRGGIVGDPLPLALGNDDADKIICFFIVARGCFLLRIEYAMLSPHAYTTVSMRRNV